MPVARSSSSRVLGKRGSFTFGIALGNVGKELGLILLNSSCQGLVDGDVFGIADGEDLGNEAVAGGDTGLELGKVLVDAVGLGAGAAAGEGFDAGEVAGLVRRAS